MKISITADLTRPHTHYIHVDYFISGLKQDKLILSFPVWSPGSYLVREYQSQVEDLNVTDQVGRKIHHIKIDKSRWQLETKNVSAVKVSYRVYTHEVNVRSCYLDHNVGFFNPTSVFFFIEGQLALPLQFRLRTLSKWQTVAATVLKKGVATFKNFDEFYDTPFLSSADLTIEKFKVRQTQYTMAFWGAHFGDTKKIAADSRKIVTEQVKIFGSHPSKNYVFQVVFVRGQYGGLEHANSSTNLFDGSLLADEKKYREFLALLSHEHFHLWNVKRIRPRELGPFDYSRENYTRDLWISEGFTSYYDDLCVWRAGLMSHKQYLDVLCDNIARYENQHAKFTNSLSESSFDSWIRLYRPNENSSNRVMSYYLKGLLVGHQLNWEIMRATKGRKSLDDVMRGLYKMYLRNPSTGFTRGDFWNIVRSVAPVNVSTFEKKYVDGLDPLNWDQGLRLMGLSFKDKDKKKSNYLGIQAEEKSGKLYIKSIMEKSPAYESDLRAGDEIIAINDRRVDKDKQIDPFLKQKKIQVLFSRFGTLHTTAVNLGDNRRFNKKIEALPKPSAQQKHMRKSWLGKKW